MLHWSHFTVATSERGFVVGIGQLKHHNDGTMELASLVVREEWRGAGIAGSIVESIVSASPKGLYLTCIPNMETYYARFGFTRLQGDEILSRYFRRIEAFSGVIHRLSRRAQYPIVMYRPRTVAAKGETSDSDT